MCAPYPEQETEELADEVIARVNPETTELEGLEFLFFSMRLSNNEMFEIPMTGSLRLVGQERSTKLANTQLWQKVKRLEDETVCTLARPRCNNIVEVTDPKVVFDGSRTPISRNDIYAAYEELLQEGSLWADKRNIAHEHKWGCYLWPVTPAILLKVLENQVEPIKG